MIIKSNPITADSKPSDIFNYCMFNDKNEDINIINGDFQDVVDCFEDANAFNRKNSLLHIQASSKEVLTHQQFMNLRQNIIDELNVPSSYVVASSLHTYKGHEDSERDPQHIHILLRMINPENGKPIDLSNKYQRQEKIARMFEVDNNLALVKGRHNVAVYHAVPEQYKEALKHLTEGPLPNSFLRDGQYQLQQRNGVNSFEIRSKCKELLSQCDNLQAFNNAIQEHGWSLEQGTKKIILNDKDGNLVGSVDRILGMKKDEFEQFKGDFEIPKSDVASPIISRTKPDNNNTGEGLHPVEPAKATEASEKPIEADKATTEPKAPEQHQKASGGDSMNVEADKIATSSDMSQEQKDAINQLNKKSAESEQDIKDLEKRIRERNQILDDLLKPKKEEYNIFDSWKNHLNNEKDRNQSIIDLPHPKLKNVDIKDIRSFIYKNFKDELIEFKKEKDKLKEIKIKIKDLDNALLFKGSRQAKAEKEQQEQIQRMALMALHLTHLIMFKLGLTKQKPNSLNYMTQQQINEYKKQYHHNEYAQRFVKCNSIKEAVNAISDMKKQQIEGRLLDWNERDEVKDAKEVIRKILRIEKLDISEFNQDEHHQYEKLVKDKDINNVNELLTEKNIRISREEQEQDNEFAPDDNDKEIEKKLYRQKVKKSGPSFNR